MPTTEEKARAIAEELFPIDPYPVHGVNNEVDRERWVEGYTHRDGEVAELVKALRDASGHVMASAMLRKGHNSSVDRLYKEIETILVKHSP